MAEETNFNLDIPGENPTPSIGDFADSMKAGDPPAKTGGFSMSMDNILESSAQKAYAEPQMSIYDQITRAKSPGAEYWSGNQVDQYIYQDGFSGLGFTPDDPYNNQRAIDNETWGTAMGKAFDSAGFRFGNTFTDWWKEYGRMGEALLSADWDKIRPDESTMIDQYYRDQMDSNKNFVFASAEDQDSIFTKKFAADMISNSGFALGTFAALSLELTADAIITAATEGAGAVTFGATFARIGGKLGIKSAAKFGAREAIKEGTELAVKKGFSFGDAVGDFAKGFGNTANQSVDALSAAAKTTSKMDEAAKAGKMGRSFSETAADAINETFTVMSGNLNGMWKSKGIGEFAENFAKGLPLVGTGVRYGEKMVAAAKAGRSGFEVAGMGLQGVRRLAQEMNMSATEASFEAVTTYGDTLDKMVQQYKFDNNGETPDPQKFEEFRQLANDAAGANFNTNLGILMATNKLQFGNMFNRFNPASKVLREAIEETSERALIVEGRDLATKKLTTKIYEKGLFGSYSALGEISKDYGKKQAAYQFGKAFVKDFGKFEISEGIQENLQETSSGAWRDYYMAKAKGVEKSISDAFGENAAHQFTKQGFKTFLMGAMTGSVIRIPTAMTNTALQKVSNAATSMKYKNDPDADPIKQADKQFKNDIAVMNSVFKQAATGKFDQKVFNFANQVDAAQEQAAAAVQGKQYEFENGRDNALISAIAAAKRTNSIKALEQAVRNMGKEMSNEEFEAAFNIKLEDTKYATASEFAESVGRDIRKYSDTIDGIKRKVGQLADPFIYEKGSKDRYVMALMRNAQEDAVHTIAINVVKGEMATNRARQLAKDIAALPGISESSDFAMRVLTNPDMLAAELSNAQAEMRIMQESMKADGVTAETKAKLEEQIKDKQEEIKLISEWGQWWSTNEKVTKFKDADGNEKESVEKSTGDFVGKRNVKKVKVTDDKGVETEVEEEEFDLFDNDVYLNFMKLMRLKNKQLGMDVDLIGEFPFEEAFGKIVDYMRLEKDSKEYLKSVDVLFNKANFYNMLERMTDGQFKYILLQYLDNAQQLATKHAIIASIALNVDDIMERAEIFGEIAKAMTESAGYKNLQALALDPKSGVGNNEYAQKQIDAITDTINKTIIGIYERYIKMKEYTDISDEEYKEFTSSGQIGYINFIRIANKLHNKVQLTEREQEVYDKYKIDIDPIVEQYKEAGESTVVATPAAPDPDEETPVASATPTPKGPTPPGTGPAAPAAPAPAATPAVYILVEDQYLGFGILHKDDNDYWYDEDGRAMWNKDRAAVQAKIDELNGVAPAAAPASAPATGPTPAASSSPTPGPAAAPAATGTKEEMFPVGELFNATESGDVLKVIGYTKAGVRFEVQQDGIKPTKNLAFTELQRLLKEGKLTPAAQPASTTSAGVVYPTLKTVKVDLQSLSLDELKNVAKQLRQKAVDARAAEKAGKTVLGGSQAIEDDYQAVKALIEELEKAGAQPAQSNEPALTVNDIKPGDKFTDRKLGYEATVTSITKDGIVFYDTDKVDGDMPFDEFIKTFKPSNTPPSSGPAAAEPDFATETPGATSLAEQLAALKAQREGEKAAAGEAPDQDPFTVTGDPESGFDVEDGAGDTVNSEPFPTQAEADDLASSLNATRADIEIVSEFMDDPSPAQVTEFVERARRSMEAANKKNGTAFANLDEFAKTPRGKTSLKTIGRNVSKMKTTQEVATEPVVIVPGPVDQSDLFDTTTSSQAASLTLESLKALDEKLGVFKAKVNQSAEEFSKFVEEDTSTTSPDTLSQESLLNSLRDIHLCS